VRWRMEDRARMQSIRGGDVSVGAVLGVGGLTPVVGGAVQGVVRGGSPQRWGEQCRGWGGGLTPVLWEHLPVRYETREGQQTAKLTK